MDRNTTVTWELSGSCYIMTFKFPKQYVLDNFLAEPFRKNYYGNIGTIFLADYQSSNMGPFRELFFVPGKFRFQRRNLQTVSRAFVSTEAAMNNAGQNWGIPKVMADFDLVCPDRESENLKVTVNGVPVMDIIIRTPESGFPFPVNSFVPKRLVQQSEGKTYFLNLQGRGFGKLGQILKVDVNPALFPNFAFFKHVAIIRVRNFRLKIPAAKTINQWRIEN